MNFEILQGDCLALLKTLPDCSVDSVVTDPPYGLGREPTPAELTAIVCAWILGEAHEIKGRGFMGKSWDAFVPHPDVWRECLRVLKPGGHLVAFAGTRTQDLMGLALRLAGFEIRDCLQWIYGSGFPKSLDVSKAIETGGSPESIRRAAMGADYRPSGRGRVNYDHVAASAMNGAHSEVVESEWSGWGTALKPAYEPILLCRKPLDGTVAANVLAHGTGGINVDGCRVDCAEKLVRPPVLRDDNIAFGTGLGLGRQDETLGRWPANVILDEAAGAMLDAQAGGGPSRFFYCAKASRAEREAGLDHLELAPLPEDREEGSAGLNSPRAGTGRRGGRRNVHPTVKPVALMRWLVRLVTPPGGTVLDPFTGSGSTGIAALAEGFEFLGFEMETEYCRIAWDRITASLF